MSAEEANVVRAAWEVCRRMGLPLEFAAEFRARLERQLADWHEDDEKAVEGVAA